MTEGPDDDKASAEAETVDSGESAGSEAETQEALRRGAALGRYIIVEELGSGAMGIVYSAFDPDLDRKVALKVLRKSRDPAARARLLREAQAMAKLSHPNVVTVYEVATEGARDFVSMEYVDGQTLDEWQSEKHPTSEVLSVYHQAGLGLAAAHRAGLVHRDFKPHNVLIDKEGRVRVTDFGLAQQVSMALPVDTMAQTLLPEENERGSSKSGRSGSLTRTGAVMGTPAYMAPEQHLAQSTDARTDQFSFCVALYQALSGSRPFEAETYAELKERVTTGPLPQLPETVALPNRVRAAIKIGMSRAREDRHESMDALLRYLAPEASRGHPLLYVGLIAASLVVVFVVGMRASKDRSACEIDRSLVAEVWNDDVRGKMRTAFAMTNVDGAGEVFAKFESIADQYADDLVAMRLDICEAGRGPKAAEDALILKRMTCLLGRRQKFLHLTTSFSTPNRTGVNQVVESAGELPAVADCGDADALKSEVALPPPEQKSQIAELQESLGKASAEGEAGHIKEAIRKTEAIRDQALVLDYKPLLAEAFVALGNLYRREGRVRDAEQAFEEAILAAEESGYTEFRARALVGVTQLIASGSSRFDEARRYARRAKAAIAQWGDAPLLSLEVERALAHILMQEGKAKEAYELMVKTLASYREHEDAKPVRIAELQNNIAALLIELGRYDEAHALAQDSYEVVRAELADSNPKTYAHLSTLTTTQRMRGEYDEARRLDKINRAYWEGDSARSLLEEDDDYTPNSRSVRGVVHDAQGIAISGATVVCGEQVIADGRYIDASWSAERDALMRRRVTQSKQDGSFHCERTSAKDLIVVAEHPSSGRSSLVRVPASAGAGEVELLLQATGVLTGMVSKGGQPAEAQAVQAMPASLDASEPVHVIVTFLRPDGSYRFEGLAPGKYVVFAGPRSSDHRLSLQSKEIEILPKTETKLDFDQSGGDAEILVTVRGEAGVAMPSVQILLAPGHVEGGNAKDFNAGISAGAIDIRSHFADGGEEIKMEGVEAGLHSLCVVPIGGDYRDPEHMKRFSKEAMDKVLIYCEDLTLAPGETKIVERAVPAWQPLIDIDKGDKVQE